MPRTQTTIKGSQSCVLSPEDHNTNCATNTSIEIIERGYKNKSAEIYKMKNKSKNNNTTA
jgi:hypothetical protein